MDNDNLDQMIEDALNNDAEQPADAPAAEEGGQEGSNTAENEDAEKRSRNAEKRIRRENRIAEEARQKERARFNELLKSVGIERDDGTTIDDVDALEAFRKAQSDERIAQGRANAEDIRRIAQEATRPDKGSADVDKELEMIREMDPEYADLEAREVLGAILQSDIGDSFRKHVDSGATFIQAYGRATRERNARAEGARSAAAAKAAGKGHLGATKQRGEGAMDVPADEMKWFRELIPGASDQEIRDFYNRDKKRIK